jgi:hypothetical protein
LIVSCWHSMQPRMVMALAAMAWPSRRFGGPRARCADEQGFPSWIRPGDRPPVQRSEIARYNVELLQVIEGPPGQPGGPSTVFGMGLIEFGPPAPVIWSTSRGALSGTLARRHKSPCSSEVHDELECLIRVQSLAAASRDQCELVLAQFNRWLAHLPARCAGIFVCVGHDTCSSLIR